MKKETQDIIKHENQIEIMELDNAALDGVAGGSDGDETNSGNCDNTNIGECRLNGINCETNDLLCIPISL